MSKMKEIDEIAQGIADVTKELMEDSIDWQIADQPVNGDEYKELHDMVMFLAIEKMYMSTKRKYYELKLAEWQLILMNYKQNKITTG